MFEVKGRNRRGDIESVILQEQNVREILIYARRYFNEVSSIRYFNPDRRI